MCQIDYCDERVEVFQSTQRKARKEHVCDECRRSIAIGETYLYEYGATPGYPPDAYRTCAHCQVGRRWLSKNCGGFMYMGVMEEIEEHAKEYRLPGLFRLTAGANRKWRRFDGAGLMAIPALPPELVIHHS